jgi:hypothetical protein
MVLVMKVAIGMIDGAVVLISDAGTGDSDNCSDDDDDGDDDGDGYGGNNGVMMMAV